MIPGVSICCLVVKVPLGAGALPCDCGASIGNIGDSEVVGSHVETNFVEANLVLHIQNRALIVAQATCIVVCVVVIDTDGLTCCNEGKERRFCLICSCIVVDNEGDVACAIIRERLHIEAYRGPFVFLEGHIAAEDFVVLCIVEPHRAIDEAHDISRHHVDVEVASPFTASIIEANTCDVLGFCPQLIFCIDLLGKRIVVEHISRQISISVISTADGIVELKFNCIPVARVIARIHVAVIITSGKDSLMCCLGRSERDIIGKICACIVVDNNEEV